MAGRKERHWLLSFGLAGGATACSTIFTNPMEVVKTRMQLQGELLEHSPNAKRVYRNLLHAFYKICRDEGLKGIQAGLRPGIVSQIFMNGTRLGLYEPLQGVLGATKEGKSHMDFFVRNMLAGAIAGACGAVLGNPMYLVKARLQSQSSAHSFRTGSDVFQYSGMMDAFRTIIRTEGGLKALLRGMDGNVPRVMVGSATQLSVYSQCKSLVLSSGMFKDDVYCHLASSMVSGLVVSGVMNPFDVVSTRLFSQTGSKYSGPLDCFQKTIRKEGLRGLFKGWAALYFRIGPHTVLTFLFWEKFKKWADTAGL